LNYSDYRGSKWAFDFDTASLTVRSLKFKSVLLVSYDVYVEGMIGEIDVRLLFGLKKTL
jgi:hypothetical protein